MLLVESKQSLLFNRHRNMGSKFIGTLNSRLSAIAVFPVFNGMAVCTQSLQIFKRIVISITVSVMNYQRRQLITSTILTGYLAFTSICSSKPSKPICMFGIKSSMIHCRTFSRTKLALSALKCLSSCYCFSAHHTWSSLMTSRRAIEFGFIMQLSDHKDFAARWANSLDLVFIMLIAAFSRAAYLAHALTKIVTFKLFSTDRAGIHQSFSFAGFAFKWCERAAKLAFHGGDQPSLAHLTIIPQGVQ